MKKILILFFGIGLFFPTISRSEDPIQKLEMQCRLGTGSPAVDIYAKKLGSEDLGWIYGIKLNKYQEKKVFNECQKEIGKWKMVIGCIACNNPLLNDEATGSVVEGPSGFAVTDEVNDQFPETYFDDINYNYVIKQLAVNILNEIYKKEIKAELDYFKGKGLLIPQEFLNP